MPLDEFLGERIPYSLVHFTPVPNAQNPFSNGVTTGPSVPDYDNSRAANNAPKSSGR